MSRLADAARTFDGVRFKHRGRDSNGIDCAGLVVASYALLGVPLPDFRLYGREPFNDQLTQRIISALGPPVVVGSPPLAALRDGDVIEIRYVTQPHHVAIVGERFYDGSPRLTMIHADLWASPAIGRKKAGRVHEHILGTDQLAQVSRVFRRPV